MKYLHDMARTSYPFPECLISMFVVAKELYELKELIGRGSSGRVFRAVRKDDKLQVGQGHGGPRWAMD